MSEREVMATIIRKLLVALWRRKCRAGRGFWSGRHTTFFGLSRDSKRFALDLALLFGWLAESRIQVPIKAVFALTDIQRANRTYAQGSGVGSIVLDVSSA
jgi:NADPH:quinone reductase-like Zn-dependent oxidoreductase